MSLDREQMEQTGADLRRNLEASGLSRAEVASWLGIPEAEVAGILAMDGRRSPVDVWAVRDALDGAVRAAGREPDWHVLDAGARRKAQQWFVLRELPPRP